MTAFLRRAALALALLAAVAARADTVLETARFRLHLASTGALSVEDKAAHAVWTQPALPVRVSEIASASGELRFTVNETLHVRIVPSSDAVDFHLEAAPDASVEGLEFPAGFTLANADSAQTLLLPYCAGFAIPFAMKNRADLERIGGYYETGVDQGGLMMPWIATTDGKTGCLMSVRTPYDSRMRVWTDDRGYQYAVAWKNTHGRFGYTRVVRYHFRADGGAVALCKTYRDEAKADGLLVTLKEKRQRVPSLDRFLGALSLWIAEWPDLSLIKQMKAADIDRLLVSYHVTGPIPAGITNRVGHNTTYEAIDRTFAAELHQLGYLAGRYDYYRTIYPPSDSGRGGNGWVMRFTGYPEQLALDENGRIRAGFQGGNAPAGAQPRGHRCSKCQYELARIYIPLDVDRVGYDARLLDAVCAVRWQECYSSAHPVTREQDMLWRCKQLEVAMDNAQLTGTEHMGFWAVPHAIYAEAPTTFVRFAPYREAFNGSSFAPPASYSNVVLDERIRFPLWQLVFHDAMVITNRWTFTANRYTDEKIWDKEDLINLLHGQMPTFMLDRANFERNAAHFAHTAKTVGAWNARTGYEEMIDFRWLAADGSVQQAVYASGANVIVNFGSTEFTLPSGEKIAPRGHLTRERL